MRLIQEPGPDIENAEVTIHMTVRQLRIIEAVMWRVHTVQCPPNGEIHRLWADAYQALGELGFEDTRSEALLFELGAGPGRL